MCGIAGIYIKNPKFKPKATQLNRFADELLLGIEHRGKHATGFVATTFDNKIVLDKGPIAATDFITQREKIPAGAQAILLHTRFMTQGPVENNINNHPVIYKTCFAVHNGSIRNDDDLFKEHELVRNGEVDTEIIPALLDKYGMDSAESVTKALKEFKGHLAIAAIDPVRYQGQLLLAKGEGSPLHIYHTKDYIVWASEGKVIRDAWAKVFGTPPDWGNIGYMQEGKFWLVNGKDVKETKYEITKAYSGGWINQGNRQGLRPSPRRQSIVPTRTRRNGSNTGRNGRPTPWEGKDSLFITEKEFQDTVTAWRAQYEGGDNVRIWAHRDNYTKKDFEDVKSFLSWVPCLCGEQVLSDDTKHHVKYGSICFDCYQVITDKYKGRADAEEKHEEETEEATVKVFSLTPEDRQALIQWAEVDARMNVLTIDEVCKLIGYDYNTVEYLVWRNTTSGLTAYARAVDKLAEDVKKIYKAVEAEMWEQHGNEVLGIDEDGEPDDQHVAFTVKKGDGVSELWFRCILHQEEYRSGDECQKCKPQEGRSIPRYACMDCGEWFPRYQVKWVYTGGMADSDYICEECDSWALGLGSAAGGSCEVVTNPLAITPLDDVIRCAQCAAFKKRDEDCRVCEQSLKELATRSATTCYCNTAKGKACKRPVKFILNGKGYCNYHFAFCNRNKCDAKANHLLLDGARVCHSHARKEKGAQSDKQLGKSGMTITEVQKSGK